MSDHNIVVPDSYPPRERKRDKHRNQRVQHFEVSQFIHCKLDFDFALALGQLLLEVDTDDKRFKSFGHHLCNLEGDEQS